MSRLAGFREVEHTADWELEVWAPDFSGLLEQAALGMYQLAGVRILPEDKIQLALRLSAADRESLLVSFLAELLYYQEQEGLVFDQFKLSLEGDTLQAVLNGRHMAGLDKEIKAVTYHNLQLRQSGRGLEARIVFDV